MTINIFLHKIIGKLAPQYLAPNPVILPKASRHFFTLSATFALLIRGECYLLTSCNLENLFWTRLESILRNFMQTLTRVVLKLVLVSSCCWKLRGGVQMCSWYQVSGRLHAPRRKLRKSRGFISIHQETSEHGNISTFWPIKNNFRIKWEWQFLSPA